MKKKVGAYILGALVLFGILGGVILVSLTKEKKEKNPVTGISYSEANALVNWLTEDEEKIKALTLLVDPLRKSDNIDVQYIINVAEILDIDEACYNELIKGNKETEILSLDIFMKIFDNMVATDYNPKLSKKDMLVLDVGTRDESSDIVATIFDGYNSYSLSIELNKEDVLDRVISCYICDGVIIKYIGESQESVVITNAYIKSVSDEQCEFVYNNLTKVYSNVTDGEAFASGGAVGDISISNEGVVSISFEGEIIEDRISMIADAEMRLIKNGDYLIGENCKVYDISINDRVISEEALRSLMGYEQVKLRIINNTVQGIIISDNIKSENIRVLLNNSDYSSYKMEQVTVTSNEDFYIAVNDGEKILYTGGEQINIKIQDYSIKDLIKVGTQSELGKVSILELNRNGVCPEYRGVLEMTVNSGYVNVVNEVKVEEYLYGVVSSEVPSSYPEECLKAMAVCARGYAFSRMEAGTFSTYGAHLDDSTLCQVYNSVCETEESIKAVKDTYGMVATFNEELVTPFYYSTSFGVSSSNDQIWGGEPYEYLQVKAQNTNRDEIDLSDESKFIEFVNSSNNLDIIEKDLPYYRWSIHFTDQQITDAINAKIEERTNLSIDTIKIQSDGENFVNGDVSSVGNVENIEVTERYPSGVIKTFVITGSENTIQVAGQSNIRSLITPYNVEIIKNDGSSSVNWTSLPSPFYYIQKVEGGYDLIGGGFGHGVGLSQNGAKALAELDYDYEYIIKYYYEGTELTYYY